MKKTSGFALTAVVAAGLGYVAGVLTAPKSGKETRKDIKKAAAKVKIETEKKLKELHSELDSLLKQAKVTAKKLTKGASDELADLVKKAQFAKQKAREVLSAIHEGDESDSTDKDLQDALLQAKQAKDHLKTFLKKHPEAN